eukprot:m.10382 g.10382  ORF g.10382 m.10382 type:complete len:415 (+) comp7374_c0_seq1:99-1343(+)
MMHLFMFNAALSAVLLGGGVRAGCTDGGSGGCSPPVGEKWDHWDMAHSTYTYCFHGCPMDFFINNSDSLPNPFAGVVGVDHYFTLQGMPCVDGKPQEFAHQDALTQKWKSVFPEMRFLQYRILSAVTYDMVIQNKVLTDHDAVVRWRHAPGSETTPGNDSVCYNYISECFNDPTRINDPAHNCSFHISAAAYNWTNPTLAQWFIDEVVAPTLVHADGIWLDGIGPDNGAYMCSGVCCGYGATNSPLVQTEIDAHCAAQAAATTQVQKYLISKGGWEAQKCFNYIGPGSLPTVSDSPKECASKLTTMAARGANHSTYNAIAAYTGRTGGMQGYNDTTAAATVAAFMLMRGQHWFLGISNTNDMALATAQLMTSDYGVPEGLMQPVAGQANVFERKYEKATIRLDCNTFTGTFNEK